MNADEIRRLATKGRSLIYELCGAFESDDYYTILSEAEKTLTTLSEHVRRITGADSKEGAEITVRIVQDRKALQTFISQAFYGQKKPAKTTA